MKLTIEIEIDTDADYIPKQYNTTPMGVEETGGNYVVEKVLLNGNDITKFLNFKQLEELTEKYNDMMECPDLFSTLVECLKPIFFNEKGETL